MPLPVIANAYRCAIRWQGPGTLRAVNVLHVLCPSGDIDDVANNLQDQNNALMFTSMPPTVECAGVDITPLDGESATQTYPLPDWQGTASANACMPAAAAIISLRTAFIGQRNRGRIFLPFTSEGVATNGVLDSAYVTDLQGAWEQFRIDMSAAAVSSPLAVASYLAETARAVTTLVARPILGTIRRRQSQLND